MLRHFFYKFDDKQAWHNAHTNWCRDGTLKTGIQCHYQDGKNVKGFDNQWRFVFCQCDFPSSKWFNPTLTQFNPTWRSQVRLHCARCSECNCTKIMQALLSCIWSILNSDWQYHGHITRAVYEMWITNILSAINSINYLVNLIQTYASQDWYRGEGEILNFTSSNWNETCKFHSQIFYLHPSLKAGLNDGVLPTWFESMTQTVWGKFYENQVICQHFFLDWG